MNTDQTQKLASITDAELLTFTEAQFKAVAHMAKVVAELHGPHMTRHSSRGVLELQSVRANEIMELQSQISWDLNQEKIGKTFKCIIDRKEGTHFVGRTEFDSPDVDNEVLIDATQHYLKTGEFANIKIIEATEFDLYGEPV